MAFFSKLLHFLKNIHPIRNFAKPIVRQKPSETYTVAASFASVPISYEALKEEVIETPHHLEVEQTPTFSLEQSFSTFAPEVEQEQEMHGEEYVAPVVVMRKLEVRPEESIVLASDIEEPLAPDTVIGDIVDLSQFQTEPQPAIAQELEKIVAETEETLGAVEVNMVIAETEVAPVATEEVIEKKTRKRTAKATTTKKSIKAKSSKATASAKVPAAKAKKAGKATKAKKTVSRKKTPVPQEAMGFGF